jgi:hypothetical protein
MDLTGKQCCSFLEFNAYPNYITASDSFSVKDTQAYLGVPVYMYTVRYPQRFAQNDTIFLATRLYHQTIQFGKPGPPLLLSFA